MTDSIAAEPLEQPAPITPATPREAAEANPNIQSSARWFWWIAGLSLVNIVLSQAGSNTNFVVGLGMTAVSDALFADHKIIGFVIDAIALGFFYLMGLQAQRGQLWAFYVGGAIYALDALIYVSFASWMAVGFHGLAMFYIVKGAMSLRETLRAAN